MSARLRGLPLHSPTNEDKTLSDQAQDAFIDKFNDVYDQSYSIPEPASNNGDSSIWGDMFDAQDATPPRSEAEQYLNEPVSTHPDRGGPSSLAYWKSVQHVYPQLSRMAVNYLAIQGSATPVERAWSSDADTDTKK
ncbi:hypothetical protein M422DRAFT_253217 [Sphaerobolus stellatus SS14]|uniref:HAT C-terminal dimerisation domain-containing protein n=1 Tax=Sphaerobolus stellatus (strain SS14) TaxID=990650 RepID=A0A0C9UKK3_SPHS4|nr:hypothetical protein M422DRAFT_253217 [Sphaerobolus stellatus SS14]